MTTGKTILITGAASGIGVATAKAFAAAGAAVLLADVQKGDGERLAGDLREKGAKAAFEYAARNIRVNAVSSGAIQTPMIDRFAGADPAAKYALANNAPMARMGWPEEIAETVLWLCSDAASFVTGHRRRWRLDDALRRIK